jgi:nucleoside-triphosphatase THEP1
VSGESGSGKTTWCKKIISDVHQKGMQVSGLLSPAVFRDGEKVGIDLINLSSGEKRQLAKLREKYDPQATIKKWLMDLETITWANESLKKTGACDLLVMDELGPLEFTRKQGFIEAFPLIDRADYRAALIIVRPALLAQAQARWSGIPSQVFNLNKE